MGLTEQEVREVKKNTEEILRIVSPLAAQVKELRDDFFGVPGVPDSGIKGQFRIVRSEHMKRTCGSPFRDWLFAVSIPLVSNVFLAFLLWMLWLFVEHSKGAK